MSLYHIDSQSEFTNSALVLQSAPWEPPADIPQFVKGGRYSDAAVDDTPDLDNSRIMQTEFKPADGVQVTVVRSAMTVMEYWWEECSDRSCEGDSVFAGLGLPTHGTDAKESLVFTGLDYPEHWFEVAYRHNGLVCKGECSGIGVLPDHPSI
ncbi:hypothetical protein DFH08DRAFT_804091 [Mycena albidolilacea]|uniref:Uncharacterized protein n=1 Tax=Mycena albidolilacea TaxID=1033008 RepID=A0AAD7ABA4_9AGAR|nr:hypothetical protein DFH08DRAFT_804091 [Mycena albidolilacea]